MEKFGVAEAAFYGLAGYAIISTIMALCKKFRGGIVECLLLYVPAFLKKRQDPEMKDDSNGPS